MAKIQHGVKPDILKYAPSPNRPPPDHPKFRAFFPSPAPIFLHLSSGIFSCLIPSLSRGILVVFLKAGALKCARVKPWRLWGRWGFTQQPENSKRAHLRFKHHQNSTWRPPSERRKNELSGGREKKREILGPPHFGPFGPPTPSGPQPLRPPNPSAPPPLRPPPPDPPTTRPAGTKKKNWPIAVWPNSVKQNWPISAK